ncbi:hypothetical protein BH09ACT11_BH09ACT11_14420 [soil metagenome]
MTGPSPGGPTRWSGLLRRRRIFRPAREPQRRTSPAREPCRAPHRRECAPSTSTGTALAQAVLNQVPGPTVQRVRLGVRDPLVNQRRDRRRHQALAVVDAVPQFADDLGAFPLPQAPSVAPAAPDRLCLNGTRDHRPRGALHRPVASRARQTSGPERPGRCGSEPRSLQCASAGVGARSNPRLRDSWELRYPLARERIAGACLTLPPFWPSGQEMSGSKSKGPSVNMTVSSDTGSMMPIDPPQASPRA